MGFNTKIEWATHTFNPWIGCTGVSTGCDHCYAEARSLRTDGVLWGAGKPRKRTSVNNWRQPLKWHEQAARENSRPRVFCASLADVFDNEVDEQWRADLFELIEATKNLDWLLLTKRIGNVQRLVPEATDLIEYGEGWQSMWGQGKWPENVWLGATICNQAEALRDIPKLLAVPAAVRFLSIEPMLGPIDLLKISGIQDIDWVICGGESGPNSRPSHSYWFRDLRDQCAALGIAFLFKQWGEWTPRSILMGGERDLWIEDPKCEKWQSLKVYECGALGYTFGSGEPAYMQRVGKKLAGRSLFGVTHDAFPGGVR